MRSWELLLREFSSDHQTRVPLTKHIDTVPCLWYSLEMWATISHVILEHGLGQSETSIYFQCTLETASGVAYLAHTFFTT